jgi:VCBS repeat-containing protein
MQINVIYDQSAGSLPSGFVAAVNYVVNFFDTTFANPVSVNIDLGYGEIAGQSLGSGALGESETFFDSVAYSAAVNALKANQPSVTQQTAYSTMPGSSPVSGGTLWVSTAEEKSLGLLVGNNSAIDGYVGFSSTYPFSYAAGVAPAAGQYYFEGVLAHEFSEVMGRDSMLGDGLGGTTSYTVMDLFRYSGPGARQLGTGGPAYFSINGGTTNLDSWNTNPGGDLGDWAGSAGTDSFLAFSPSGQLDWISQADLTLMNVLGWDTARPNGVVVTATPSDALQGGAAVALLATAPAITDSASTTLTSATIKIVNGSGSTVAGDKLFVNGIQNGLVGSGVTASWNATTNTLTLTGAATLAAYQTLLSEVTFQDTGTDSSSGSHPGRTVTWAVNDGTHNYNATSQISVDRAPVVAPDVAVTVAGTTLTTTAANGVLSNDSDRDGDPLTVTGVSDVAHGAGSVGQSLAGAYGHLTLNANGSYSYIADNTSGVGTGSHLQDAFSYTISDGNGGSASASLTITLDRPPVVTVANIALSAGHLAVLASTLFTSSDPDGGTIGTYAFKDTGGGHFVLNGVAQANNTEIDVAAGQLSLLSYQGVAGTADTVQVRANDGTTWSNWVSFTVTAPSLVTEAFGSTSLVEFGNDYFLYPVGGLSGPELTFFGAPAAAGDPKFGGWVTVGAEPVAGGYEVAWSLPGANEFLVWTTDSNANYISNTSVMAGNSAALENFELSFHQDLNGDGTIGPIAPPKNVIEALGSTSLVEVGTIFFLYPVGGSSGPELSMFGAPVVAGNPGFGGWVPVGAEPVAGGYEVAWSLPGANEFLVWSTDSNANYISNTSEMAGNSAALENFELSFHQDLNRDGTIGPIASSKNVAEAFGSTSLVDVGTNFFLYPVGGSSGPELSMFSAPVVAGNPGFGGWVPVGAEPAAGGYEVAWSLPGANEFLVWSTDSSANYISNTSVMAGNSAALENFELSFHQDLNGDGLIGVPASASTVSASLAAGSAATSAGPVDDGSGQLRSLIEAMSTMFPSANGAGSGALFTPGGHDGTALASAPSPDFHAGNSVVHPTTMG